MPQVFTIRWPIFARLEAILFVPVALRLAGEIEPVRAFVDRGLVPALSPLNVQLGVPKPAVFWAAAALVVIVPYVAMLLVADRFLTVRKGFVPLSVVAIAIWAGAGSRLAHGLTDYVPESLLGGTGWLSFDQEATLAIGGMALLMHLRPLWIGLRDDGDVAMRLMAARDGYSYQRASVSQTRYAQDVYDRRMADLREWQPRRQLEGVGVSPRENPTVRFLHAITWIGVIVGVGAAYLNWTGYAGFGHGKDKPDSDPAAAAGPTKARGGVKAGAPAALPPIPPLPAVHGAAAMPLDTPRVVAAAPLPMVQRPTELSASVQSAGAISGPNEAVAERGSDGGFGFDAVVNGGTHVRMLFDTGASVVGLRAEDAIRLGIPVSRLNYSVKIKTANGTADVAPVMIDTMVIGNITVRSVAGFVAKQGMLQENLLGQTFLTRLAGFNVERNLLVLKGR